MCIYLRLCNSTIDIETLVLLGLYVSNHIIKLFQLCMALPSFNTVWSSRCAEEKHTQSDDFFLFGSSRTIEEKSAVPTFRANPNFVSLPFFSCLLIASLQIFCVRLHAGEM